VCGLRLLVVYWLVCLAWCDDKASEPISSSKLCASPLNPTLYPLTATTPSALHNKPLHPPPIHPPPIHPPPIHPPPIHPPPTCTVFQWMAVSPSSRKSVTRLCTDGWVDGIAPKVSQALHLLTHICTKHCFYTNRSHLSIHPSVTRRHPTRHPRHPLLTAGSLARRSHGASSHRTPP